MHPQVRSGLDSSFAFDKQRCPFYLKLSNTSGPSFFIEDASNEQIRRPSQIAFDRCQSTVQLPKRRGLIAHQTTSFVGVDRNITIHRSASAEPLSQASGYTPFDLVQIEVPAIGANPTFPRPGADQPYSTVVTVLYRQTTPAAAALEQARE
jgi:hypothetical protein